MIKAIFFDFGGPIVTDKYSAIVEPLKAKLSPENLLEFNRWEVLTQKGKMGEEFLKKADTMLGIKKLEGSSWVTDLYKHPNLETLDLINSLRLKYRVGMLSNNFSFWAKTLRPQWFLALFDTVVISAEVGMAKPEKEIYLLAAKRVGVKPSECAFTDDHQENVDGALTAGFAAAIRFTNIASLKKDLSSLGILPIE